MWLRGYNITKTIHVAFRNLKESCGQPLIKEIVKLDKNVSAFPTDMEKYILIYMSIRILFNDSLKFINTSLVELENNLSSKILENKDLEIFVKYTHECFNKSRPLVIKKYFRLYSYLDFFEYLKNKNTNKNMLLLILSTKNRATAVNKTCNECLNYLWTEKLKRIP